MTWKLRLGIWGIIISTSASFCSTFVQAFYAGNNIELQGYVGLAGGVVRYPDDDFYFPQRNKEIWQGDFRLLAHYKPAAAITLEANILESFQSVLRSDLTSQGSLPLAVERSSVLTWKQRDSVDELAHLSVDVLALHWSSSSVDVSVGRQLVNLATTFYFVPNDFFAPFSAQTFFRTYRPGVDAARIDLRPTNLSLVSLLGVLGYTEDPTTANGWEKEPATDRSSLLIDARRVIRDFEWSMLAGSVRDHTLFGGSFQGEVARWLGIRAEGHYALPEKDSGHGYLELSVGLEHRFANSLDIRLEQFYHGSGYRSVEEMNVAVASGQWGGGYLGTQYTALGLGYEFSPLISGRMVAVLNWTDYSQLLAMSLNYSLADESELAVNISLPRGDGPEGMTLGSEFGISPFTAGLTFRHYL